MYKKIYAWSYVLSLKGLPLNFNIYVIVFYLFYYFKVFWKNFCHIVSENIYLDFIVWSKPFHSTHKQIILKLSTFFLSLLNYPFKAIITLKYLKEIQWFFFFDMVRYWRKNELYTSTSLDLLTLETFWKSGNTSYARNLVWQIRN